MTIEVNRADVQALTADGPNGRRSIRTQYEEEHIRAHQHPSWPLDRSAARLRRDDGVIVYCYDYQ